MGFSLLLILALLAAIWFFQRQEAPWTAPLLSFRADVSNFDRLSPTRKLAFLATLTFVLWLLWQGLTCLFASGMNVFC